MLSWVLWLGLGFGCLLGFIRRAYPLVFGLLGLFRCWAATHLFLLFDLGF